MFEYLAAERPILALVPPDGAAAALIREAGGRDRRRARGRRRRSRPHSPTCTRAGRRARSTRRRCRRSGGVACRGVAASKSLRGCWSGSRDPADELPVSRHAVRRDVREGALEHRGQRQHLRRPGDPVHRIAARHDEASSSAVDDGGAAGVLRALPDRVPGGLLRPVRLRRARPVGEGPDEVGDPFRIPRGCRLLAVEARPGVLLARARVVLRRDRRQRALRRAAAARCTARREPRRLGALAHHRRCKPDQRLRRDQRRKRLPAECDDRRPESPRDHADRAAA